VKKKHCCQQNAFFAINAPSEGAQMRNSLPPDHLRSEISYRALPVLQIIGKARKQREAI